MSESPPPEGPPLSGEVLPAGWPWPPWAPAPPPDPLAVASLALGIVSAASALLLGCCCGWLGGPIAVVSGAGAAVCGHLALRQIREAAGATGGRAMAVAGLVTGYAGIAIGLIEVMFIIGSLLYMLFTEGGRRSPSFGEGIFPH